MGPAWIWSARRRRWSLSIAQPAKIMIVQHTVAGTRRITRSRTCIQPVSSAKKATSYLSKIARVAFFALLGLIVFGIVLMFVSIPAAT